MSFRYFRRKCNDDALQGAEQNCCSRRRKWISLFASDGEFVELVPMFFSAVCVNVFFLHFRVSLVCMKRLRIIIEAPGNSRTNFVEIKKKLFWAEANDFYYYCYMHLSSTPRHMRAALPVPAEFHCQGGSNNWEKNTYKIRHVFSVFLSRSNILMLVFFFRFDSLLLFVRLFVKTWTLHEHHLRWVK